MYLILWKFRIFIQFTLTIPTTNTSFKFPWGPDSFFLPASCPLFIYFWLITLWAQLVLVIGTSMQDHQLECGQPTSSHVIITGLLFLPPEPLTANSFSYRAGASGPFPIHANILTGLIFCRFCAHKSSRCVQLLYYVMTSVSHGSSRQSPGSCIPSAQFPDP